MPPRARPHDRRPRHSRFPRSASRLRLFATDLDRTLLTPGERPSAAARAAVRGARELGLKTLLVSGRRYRELREYSHEFGEFDGIVAENGALIEAPLGTTPVVIGRRTGARVRDRLEADVSLPVEFGEVVASVPREMRPRLRRAVAGLPVDLVANVGHVMVLPHGVTKASGTRRALRQLRIPGAGYAAIGDAENDLDLLRGAVLSGAVANAVPEVRGAADYLCRAPSATGVLEFVVGPLTAAMAPGANGRHRREPLRAIAAAPR
ncbi:MAG: HAD family hydrolase [Thermoplasmata archaeon]